MTDSKNIEEYSDRELLDQLCQECIKLGQYNFTSEWDKYREESNVINVLYNEVYARLWDRTQMSIGQKR